MEAFQGLGEECPDAGSRRCQGAEEGRPVVRFRHGRLSVTRPHGGKAQ